MSIIKNDEKLKETEKITAQKEMEVQKAHNEQARLELELRNQKQVMENIQASHQMSLEKMQAEMRYLVPYLLLMYNANHKSISG